MPCGLIPPVHYLWCSLVPVRCSWRVMYSAPRHELTPLQGSPRVPSHRRNINGLAAARVRQPWFLVWHAHMAGREYL